MAGASRTSITVKNSSCDKYIHKSTCSGCNVTICFFFDTATAPDFSDLALAPSNSGEIAKLGISSTVKFQKSSGTTVDSSTDITKIVNYEFTNGNLKYKITANKTVAVTGATSTSLKSITIPATVTNGGTKYKVTSIEAGAFKNYTNLKKVVIGKNIKTIGKKAFYGGKKLKTVKIKSSKITSIGKNAFKKVSTKATIKCPSSKLKAYKKLLKKSGISSKVTIK